MERSESAAYMASHLQYAGVRYYIFSEVEIDEIQQYTSGAAQLINKLATLCLLYSAQNGHRIFNDRIVKKVIEGRL